MKRIAEDKTILLQIQPIKAEHPLWGYRFIWAYLRYQKGICYNKKRIYRIMKEHNLLVTKNNKLKAKRDNQSNKSKPRATRPNQFWGTDMTKVMIAGFGWAYLVIVLDWYTKKIIGYSIAKRSRAKEWLQALSNACNMQFPEGVLSKQQPLSLISDNGSQPTSLQYLRACSVLEIERIFASYNNPKGNADTERVIRTIKKDLLWIREFVSLEHLQRKFKLWIVHYNSERPHSTLGYRTPLEFEKEQLLVTNNY